MKKFIFVLLQVLIIHFSFGQFSEKQNFGASNLTEGDEMGSAVAIYENTIAVGSYYYSATSSSPGHGCVFVYTTDGNSVTELQQIEPSTTYISNFGNSIDIDGDYMIIGANAYTPDGDYNPGAAYFYHFDGSQWNLTQRVSTIIDYDLSFGQDVAISGNYAVIGASGRNAVFLYKLQGSTWIAIDSVFGENSGDQFGWAVEIYNNEVFVSANEYNSGAGKVYYYTIDADTMNFNRSFVVSSSDYYGYDLAYDGTYLVVGETGRNKIYFYDKNNSWAEQVLTSSDVNSTDHLGCSVSISGNYAIAGAWAKNSMTGSAYIFENNSGTWQQAQKIVASNGDGNDRFGYSVTLHNYNAVVGAYYDNFAGSYSGSAYLFASPPPPSPTITQQPQNADVCEGSDAVFSITATNATSYQWFKDDIAISDDANFSGTTTDQLTISNTNQTFEGNYFCVASNSQGDDTSATAVLIVDLMPTANAGEDQAVCTDSAYLNATNPDFGSGEWSITGGTGTIVNPVNTNTLVYGLSYGDNTFLWTVTNGACSTSDEVTITNNLPQIISQPFDTTIDEGNNLTLEVVTAGTIDSWQWYKNMTAITDATTNTLTITNATTDDNGDYYCLMQTSCGQISSDTATVTVTPATSIDEFKTSVIKPNPATYYIQMPFDGKLTIVNMQGKILISREVTKDMKLNISNLNQGLYIVTLTNTQKTTSTIIEKQ